MQTLQNNEILGDKNSSNYNFKWLSKVESILNNVGYQNLWDTQHQYESKLPLLKNIGQFITKYRIL